MKRQMKKLLSVTSIVLLSSTSLALGQEVSSTESGTALASVGDVEITGVDIAIVAERTFAQLSQIRDEQRSEFLVQTAVDMNLMALAAAELGLANSALFQRRLAFERARLLQEAYVQQIATEFASAENVQKVYDDYVADFVPTEQRRFSHILVRTEDDARRTLRRIEQGEDFGAVGAEVSLDPTAKTSLDIGFVARKSVV